MRILVVGASGLVGWHVVRKLGEAGHEVTALARTARPGIDHAMDVTEASVDDFRTVLAGHDGVVFAAGIDDRHVPAKPAYSVFRRGNVDPVEHLFTAAAAEGVTRGVVLGSYFAYFNRQNPEWRLTDTHPYIRSRVEQAAAARAHGIPITVLELPFVFGRAGDRLTNWAPALGGWVRSRSPLFAPPGGTAATTAHTVAEKTVEALEHPSNKDIPVCDENLTWHDMIARIAAATTRTRRVHTLPRSVMNVALRATGTVHSLQGKESGLDTRHMADLFTRELFLPGGTPGAIEETLRETFSGE